jgi:hypothetical protein
MYFAQLRNISDIIKGLSLTEFPFLLQMSHFLKFGFFFKLNREKLSLKSRYAILFPH